MATGEEVGYIILSYVLLFFISYIGGIIAQILSYGYSFPFTKRSFGPYINSVRIPAFLGNMIICLIIQNISSWPFAHLQSTVSTYINKIALVAILFKAGLALDLSMVKSKIRFALCLGWIPQICEAFFVFLLFYFMFLRSDDGAHVPPTLGISIGFMCAGISPAVVVPTVTELQSQGYGERKALNSVILVAVTLDVILASVMFTILSSLTLTSSHLPLIQQINEGLQVVVDIVGGIVLGIALGFLTKTMKNWKNSHAQFAVLFIIAIIIIVFCSLPWFQFGNAQNISVLLFAAMARQFWKTKSIKTCATHANSLWKFISIFLFGIIGKSLDFRSLGGTIIYKSIIILVCATIVRFFIALLVSLGNGLTKKENLFVGITWTPKATVQASLAPLILSIAYAGKLTQYYDWGLDAQTLGVLYIFITATMGAILITSLGPKLLIQKIITPEQEKTIRKKSTVISMNWAVTNRHQTILGEKLNKTVVSSKKSSKYSQARTEVRQSISKFDDDDENSLNVELKSDFYEA